MEISGRSTCLVSENEAAAWIEDGMTVALGEPAPMALVRQIIRRRVRNLTVVAGGLAIDLLIAAGCVRKTISYYAGGSTAAPVAPSFRAAAERGDITVWECEEGLLTSGLEAAAKGLPYLPWRGGVGSSLPDINPDLKLIRDPIAGQALIAVPAIKPDVAIVHAAAADDYGNVQHEGGPGWIDLFLCRAAERVLVQVEKIISNEAVRANPWATTLAEADGIVRVPWGAHPFYSRGHYIQDVEFIEAYVEVATRAARGDGAESLDGFLNRYCHTPVDHCDYLEQVGLRRLLGLNEYGRT